MICATEKRGAVNHQIISVGFKRSYPRTSYILVVSNLCTIWIESFAIGGPKASVIFGMLEKQVCYGYPKIIISDNGTQFTSVRWTRILRTWRDQDYQSRIYHPRANPAERRTLKLKKKLRDKLQGQPHTHWSQMQLSMLHKLRTIRNVVTGT